MAEHSARIANRRGLAANASDERGYKGDLLDVVELWELWVASSRLARWAMMDSVCRASQFSQTRRCLRRPGRGLNVGIQQPETSGFKGQEKLQKERCANTKMGWANSLCPKAATGENPLLVVCGSTFL